MDYRTYVSQTPSRKILDPFLQALSTVKSSVFYDAGSTPVRSATLWIKHSKQSRQWRRQLFLSGEAKTFLGGHVYMVANNALPQYGTHITPLFQVPLPFPWSLFSLCFLWFHSFPPLFHSHLPPLPSSDTVRGLGERCKLPQRVRANPAAKCNLVNSGPIKWAFSNMPKWQTKVFSKLSYIQGGPKK